MIKSADITRIDRGDTKAVRLLLEITPKFLAAARTPPPRRYHRRHHHNPRQ